jgi:DNA repair protein RecN (Recombination protein N)
LRSLGGKLVDLHGQHDHQALLNPLTHGGFFDSWIGAPVSGLLAHAADLFAKVRGLQDQLATLNRSAREREQRRDMLAFQVQEIEEAALRPGEIDALEVQLTRLSHRAKLESAIASACTDLDSGEWNVRELLAQALKTVQGASSLDPSLQDAVALLDSASIQLEEGWAKVRDYANSLEYSEESIEAVAARLDRIKLLLRKYGETEVDVLTYFETIRTELTDTEDVEQRRIQLETEIQACTSSLQKTCDDLTKVRKAHVVGFSEGELAMAAPRFEVKMTPKPPSADGQETLEFYFSANAGELPRPLAKIASGGEISRLMLALKTLLAGKVGVPTLIFDEVDTGLSGKTAAVMARKLEELANYHQILVITHLPQIASRATQHFRIEKVSAGDRTVTEVRALADEERVHEIARLLAGEEVTATSLANATELLAR